MVLGMEAQSVFEFGCGFSSKAILQALELTGGSLISCDLRTIEDTGNSREDLEKHKSNWHYIRDNSLNLVKTINSNVFDFVLHDGSHESSVVEQDLKNILPRMKKDSLLVVHDTEHPTIDYRLTPAVEAALKPYEHSKVTLPYGYGLTVIRIEHDFGNGAVQIHWRKRG